MSVILGGVEQEAARIVGSSGPGYGLFAIVPHDNNNLPSPARAIYVTGAGTLSGVGFDGVTFGPITLPANFLLPVGALLIKATDTTCTGIWGVK